MSQLIAVSPIGKNGQTVVPALIRKMFKMRRGASLVGFFMSGKHVEIAPVKVEKSTEDYSTQEISKIVKLAKEKGGKAFTSAGAAKAYLKSL
jgi:bifunctional DNA-binding transcriptional regulator/antitoxin component of YhaV-PrlF toxin-antitoxin module